MKLTNELKKFFPGCSNYDEAMDALMEKGIDVDAYNRIDTDKDDPEIKTKVLAVSVTQDEKTILKLSLDPEKFKSDLIGEFNYDYVYKNVIEGLISNKLIKKPRKSCK